jgi:RNA polymerase sigma-70 factor, ECF subfamily
VTERIWAKTETHGSTEPVSLALAPPCAATDPSDTGGQNFPAIYAEYFPFVWRCLRSLGVAACDDAAQDVFLVVHRQLGTFRGASTMRTWLYSIVRNVASNHRRSLGRKGHHEQLPPALACARPGPLEEAEDAEAADFVQNFAAGLDQKKREVFVLAMLEEMSIPEVAEALGVPVNTAYTRLRSVRQEFIRALSSQGDSHG